ncbi:MAG: nfdA 1 [Gemmatimonadetes bacterium]|nr:nfdA 1 [Gemmatimonadota bacterium]
MHPRPLLHAAVLAAAFAACPAHSQRGGAAPPDLILTGGRIFTANPAHPWAQAIAIRGERVVAVGTTAQVERLAGRGTRRLALGGRVVVPGFNDAHDHYGGPPVGVVVHIDADPIAGAPPAAVLDSVRAAAARTPRGTWVTVDIGLAVLESPLVQGGTIRAVLDSVAPDHPVHLATPWGHGHLVNTAALRAAGIAEDVRDPVGGWYGRDASGRLNGVLNEGTENAFRASASARPDAEQGASLRAYADEAGALGITSVQDMANALDPAATLRAVRAATAAGPLPIRLRLIRWAAPGPDGRNPGEWDAFPAHPARGVALEGTKWILDGTPLERGAVMRAPYADRAGWKGRLDFPVDTIRQMLREALAARGTGPADRQLMLHAVGDSTIRLVLGLMQQLAPDSVWRARRLRLEHGDWLSGDLIPVAKRLGVVVVQNPTHFALGSQVMQGRYGGRVAGFQAVRSLVEAGVPLAIGSDGPRSPFLNMMLAVTHPNNPAQALTREQAVAAYTRGSAYAEFAERRKGTLAPGMLADLAVLSQDIFRVPAQALPATHSVLTLLGGRAVHDEHVLRAPAGTSTERGK